MIAVWSKGTATAHHKRQRLQSPIGRICANLSPQQLFLLFSSCCCVRDRPSLDLAARNLGRPSFSIDRTLDPGREVSPEIGRNCGLCPITSKYILCLQEDFKIASHGFFYEVVNLETFLTLNKNYYSEMLLESLKGWWVVVAFNEYYVDGM